MDNKNYKLLILDPFVGVLISSRNISSSNYLNDYKILLAIQQYAIDNHMCIILIHHTRKLKSDNIFDSALGSRAVRGATTTNLILHNKRGDNATLSIQGRYIAEKHYELYYDPIKLEYELTGNQVVDTTPERKEILELFKKTEGHILRTNEIANALNKSLPNVSQLLGKMVEQGLVENVDYGVYKLKE